METEIKLRVLMFNINTVIILFLRNSLLHDYVTLHYIRNYL